LFGVRREARKLERTFFVWEIAMAIREWLDVSGDFNSISNWTGATVPVAGDDIRILKGSKDVVTNVDKSGVAFDNVTVGPEFAGTWGTPSNPFKTGAIDRLNFNGRNCRSFNFEPDGCTDLVLQSTNPNPMSFYMPDGAATNVILKQGRGIRLGAGVVITTLMQALDAGVNASDLLTIVEAGATLSTVIVDGGTFLCKAGVTAGYVKRGEWRHEAESGDITSLYMDGGTFRHLGDDSDIPTLEVFAGTFDASEDSRPKSIGGTSLKLWPRAVFNVNNGSFTITLGTIQVIGSPTIVTEPGRDLTVETL